MTISAQSQNILDLLPKDWKYDRLKDIVCLRNEKTNTASEEKDYLELEDLESGTGRILNRRNTLEVESAVTLFKQGDILFGKLRPYLEKYYQADFDGKCTGEILAFKPEKISSRFLFYNVGSHWFIEKSTALAYGAKMPRVNWQTQLGLFDLPLPPAPEQNRIARFLDASCAAIDKAAEVKRRQLETLDIFRESLIDTTVTKGLHVKVPQQIINTDWVTEIPKHWTVCRIKRVVSHVDYGISESTEPKGRFPVLKMGHIQRGEIEYRDLDFIDNVSNDLLLEKGDLLYNRTNSPDQVGKAAIFRRNRSDAITFASYLVRLRTNHRANPYFLNYVVNSNGFLSFARKLAIPSVQQSNLNSSRYCRIFIPLPPIKEQQEIVEYLDTKLADQNSIVKTIETQIDTLLTYRKSLIHECITGQRLVTEEDVNKAVALSPQ